MLYIVSDIHGNLAGFKRLLGEIRYDHKSDKMIILGDVIDRGNDSLAVLEYIRPMIDKGSVQLLLGNHELFAIMYLSGQMSESLWNAFGGGHTLTEIKKMNDIHKEKLLKLLQSLPVYTEITSEYLGNVICTHTGLDADYLIENEDGSISVTKSIEEAFERNAYNYMIGNDINYLSSSDKNNLDKFMIVGHVPCTRLNEDGSYFFVRENRYMVIDAGSSYENGRLGCYVVDTDGEIYV